MEKWHYIYQEFNISYNLPRDLEKKMKMGSIFITKCIYALDY